METAIVSLICIALILVGGMTMSQGFLVSVDSTSKALQDLGGRAEEMLRTELSPVTANTSVTGTMLYVTLTNNGQTKLNDFSKWDVIVQYRDGGDNCHVIWLPYTEAAVSDNEWTKTGIYLNGQPETLEVGILNPGEEMRVEAKLNPAVGDNTTNQVILATPSGITASGAFTHQP